MDRPRVGLVVDPWWMRAGGRLQATAAAADVRQAARRSQPSRAATNEKLATRGPLTDEATAERFYQRFKWDVIAPIEADRWVLDAGDVLGWLEQAAGTDDVVRLVVET